MISRFRTFCCGCKTVVLGVNRSPGYRLLFGGWGGGEECPRNPPWSTDDIEWISPVNYKRFCVLEREADWQKDWETERQRRSDSQSWTDRQTERNRQTSLLSHIGNTTLFPQNYKFPPISAKFINFPLFSFNLGYLFLPKLRFLLPPLCIVLYIYRTHLPKTVWTVFKSDKLVTEIKPYFRTLWPGYQLLQAWNITKKIIENVP